MTIQLKAKWPDYLWLLSDVADWISTLFEHRTLIRGPIHIYNEKSWGITASFKVGDDEVIFKGCKLSLFADRIYTEALLNRSTEGMIPKLLGAEAFPNGETWTLHRVFRGTNVYKTGDFDHIVAMAETLACIQTNVAKQSVAKEIQPFQTPITEIPKMLDFMLQRIEEAYLDVWLADDGRLLDEFDLSSLVLEQLAYFRPQVQEWVDELVAGEWTMSIDHVDFHTNNAAIQDNGQLLIFDWEEAVLSCPFFSMFRLLDDADVFEADPDSVPKTEGSLCLTKNQMTLRNVYLNVLPWKTRTKRERAFDLAMCLAPIKMAYECEPFNQAIGREHGSPEHAARCFGKALEYWQPMVGYNDCNSGATIELKGKV